MWARTDLRSILIKLVLVEVFGMNFPIFTSTMAVTVFHSDARGFGLLSSMMAVGTIGGALMAAKRDKPKFGTLCLGTGVFGVGCALAAFSPEYWWFGAALALIGAAPITFMTATNSIIQLSTERAMRGRVVAIGRYGSDAGRNGDWGSRRRLGGESFWPTLFSRHRGGFRIRCVLNRNSNDC